MNHINLLVKLAGKFEKLAESDDRYAEVYDCLQSAIDVAELEGLIDVESEDSRHEDGEV